MRKAFKSEAHSIELMVMGKLPSGFKSRKDYNRYMRAYRAKGTDREFWLNRIREIPEFQRLSKEDQDSVEKMFLYSLEFLDVSLNELKNEAEAYLKVQLKEVYSAVLEVFEKIKSLKIEVKA